MSFQFVFVALLAISFPAFGDGDDAHSIAKNIVMGGGFVDLEANAEQLARMLSSQNAELQGKDEIVKCFFLEYLRSDELADEMAKIYTENFSKSELEELQELLKSDAMQKWLRKMPEIMPRLIATQRTLIQRKLPELEARIRKVESDGT